MKKVWLVAIIAVVVVGALVFLAQRKPVKNEIATALNARLAMTAAEISAAINYGKSRKDDLLVDFEKPWTVFLGYGSDKGSAAIFTPYHCLSLMARNSARDNSDMDTEVLCRLCAENHKDSYFEVTLYGSDDGFDRDYKAALLKDGREIPILKTFHQGYDMAREYTISSRQKLYFPADILQEKGKITLRIVKPKEAPLDFVFDLKNVP
ncbi:MAG: hypothetical protein ABIK20_03620 [Candidatus Omnitrophota bacterium]|nr:hypothetical protein [Candidatus Omnitrophota bacterium]